jgi:hypothetical protein
MNTMILNFTGVCGQDPAWHTYVIASQNSFTFLALVSQHEPDTKENENYNSLAIYKCFTFMGTCKISDKVMGSEIRQAVC